MNIVSFLDISGDMLSVQGGKLWHFYPSGALTCGKPVGSIVLHGELKLGCPCAAVITEDNGCSRDALLHPVEWVTKYN